MKHITVFNLIITCILLFLSGYILGLGQNRCIDIFNSNIIKSIDKN